MFRNRYKFPVFLIKNLDCVIITYHSNFIPFYGSYEYQNKKINDISIIEWVCPIRGTTHSRNIMQISFNRNNYQSIR